MTPLNANINTNTDYWNLLPNEIVKKIIFQLDPRDIVRSRAVCRRNIGIIDSSEDLTTCISITKAEKLFATADRNMPSIESMNKNFIDYIKKNHYVNTAELNIINLLINKCNYHAVQFLLAKKIENSICTLKQICFLDRSSFRDDDYVPDILRSLRLFFTDNSNTCLFEITGKLYELQIINNKLVATTEIIKLRYGSFFISQIYKNYIVLSKTTSKGELIFLKKINGSYIDITPRELGTVSSRFIKIQTDEQGNTIFVLHTKQAYFFYNMNDSSENTIITKLSFNPEIEIYSVTTSEYNDLMIVYGKNLTSEKMEAQIYKDNKKIYTLIFETPPYSNGGNHMCICSPQGDGFIIRDVDIEQNNRVTYTIYKIFNNRINSIYNITTNDDQSLGATREPNIIYGNNGKCIFFKNDVNIILYINSDNHVQIFNTDTVQKYRFNKSGYMLLGRNNNKIQVYNFQKAEKGIVETTKIDCEHEIVEVEFSPNSQLVALTENLPSNGYQYVIRLRIYKIMSVDSSDNIKIIPNPKCIAEYYTNVLMGFKFHPDGTKIIFDEDNKVSILEISKSDTINNIEQ